MKLRLTTVVLFTCIVIVKSKYFFKNNGLGEYLYRFKTADGTTRAELGKYKEDGNYYVAGIYSYTDPDGKEQYMQYYADETGYHPSSSDIVDKFGGVDSNVLATLLG